MKTATPIDIDQLRRDLAVWAEGLANQLAKARAAIEALGPAVDEVPVERPRPAARKANPRPVKLAPVVDQVAKKRRLAAIAGAAKRPAIKTSIHRNTKPSNVSAKAAVEKGIAKGLAVSDEMFARVWNEAGRRSEVAAKLGITPRLASDRARALRGRGLKLKRHPSGRAPGVPQGLRQGRKAKPAAEDEERPVVARPEPATAVVLDIRKAPRPAVARIGSFRLFARKVANGEAKPVVAKATVARIEVKKGEIYGHWEVIREGAVDSHGRRTVLCRSTCAAKVERRHLLNELVKGRLSKACMACRVKTKPWSDEQRRLHVARQLGKKAERAGMPETFRCTVPDGGHPCGALVFAHKRRDHLQDIHFLEGSEAEIASGYSGPVDTREQEAA